MCPGGNSGCGVDSVHLNAEAGELCGGIDMYLPSVSVIFKMLFSLRYFRTSRIFYKQNVILTSGIFWEIPACF